MTTSTNMLKTVKPTTTAPRLPVLAEREAAHGPFSSFCSITADIRDAVFVPLQARGIKLPLVLQTSLEMICFKLARIANGNPNNPDTWLDIAGYAQLGLEHLTPQAPQPAAEEATNGPI